MYSGGSGMKCTAAVVVWAVKQQQLGGADLWAVVEDGGPIKASGRPQSVWRVSTLKLCPLCLRDKDYPTLPL